MDALRTPAERGTHNNRHSRYGLKLLRTESVPTVVIQLLPGARLAQGMVPCELRVRSTDPACARSVVGLELW